MGVILGIGLIVVIIAIKRGVAQRRRRKSEDVALIRAFDRSWALSNAYMASENENQRKLIAPEVTVAREDLKQQLLKRHNS